MRILIILFMLPISVWAGTFRDDFEDGDLEGWKVLNGTWQVKDGELTARHAAISPPARIEWEVALLADCTFEADVRFEAILSNRAWVMMLFRPDQVWHYLAFRINRDG
ncbi:TPA: hypothetical protein ENG04_09500, partial [Candidatus Poribacteria bacterium]|nr:hypothetical protein [Candidatus Poribacteria bacterium]HEX30301.1 hypothetical protein [Candidatus Poribacteria bacterium]